MDEITEVIREIAHHLRAQIVEQDPGGDTLLRLVAAKYAKEINLAAWDMAIENFVMEARIVNGHSWETIAEQLGVSRQSVMKRYQGRKDEWQKEVCIKFLAMHVPVESLEMIYHCTIPPEWVDEASKRPGADFVSAESFVDHVAKKTLATFEPTFEVDPHLEYSADVVAISPLCKAELQCEEIEAEHWRQRDENDALEAQLALTTSA